MKEDHIKQLKELIQQNTQLQKINHKLEERIKELERQLNLNSENSSKPPSSDGLRKKPAPQSLREKTGKVVGGQKGHVGKTLMQVEKPDHIVKHSVDSCEKCHKDLHHIESEVPICRQIFDIPEPKIIVTEHQSVIKTCPCGHKNIAKFPPNIKGPVQYGSNIATKVVYLSVQQLIPEKRIKEIFKDWFKTPINTATIENILKKAAEKIHPIQEENLRQLNKAPVKNHDESGYRIGGKTNWLQVLCNEFYTFFRPTEKRGNIIQEGLEGGIFVHDHFKSYDEVYGVLHAFCNAHHLRELKALMEIEKEEWAFEMYKWLCGANKYKKECEKKGKSLNKVVIQEMQLSYLKILAQGLLFHESEQPLGKNKKRIGHNLLVRLRDCKEETWRFLTHFECPFTNNQAEQDIRMIKVKQKISGGFRTMKGAETFCTLRGFISTQRKQGENVFCSLQTAIAL